MDSATWSSGDSHFEASGQLVNYSDPQLQLEYKAELEAGQLAKLSQMDHVRRGRVQISGSAHYGNHRLDTRGKLALRDGEWVSGGVRVRNLNLGTEYVIGPENASFPHVFATALGGTVSGAVEVKNWRSTNGPAPRQQGTAQLHVEGISLENAVAAASSRQLPLDRLNLRGRTSGKVDVAWSGRPEYAIAHFDLAVTRLRAANKRLRRGSARIAGWRFGARRLPVCPGAPGIRASRPDRSLAAVESGRRPGHEHGQRASHAAFRKPKRIDSADQRAPAPASEFRWNNRRGLVSPACSPERLQAPQIEGRMTLSHLVVPLRNTVSPVQRQQGRR